MLPVTHRSISSQIYSLSVNQNKLTLTRVASLVIIWTNNEKGNLFSDPYGIVAR